MYSVIITAAGSGSRAKLGYNKMLFKIDGMTLIEKTVSYFAQNTNFNDIIVTASADELDIYNELLSKYDIKIVTGGNERMHSVNCGIMAASNELVFVHDGARIFIDDKLIKNLTEFDESFEGLSLATSVIDTTLKVEDGVITEVLNRDQLFNMQTPQVVKKRAYLKAYECAISENLIFTDEMSLLSYYGYKCCIVEGASYNKKLTKPEDFKELV